MLDINEDSVSETLTERVIGLSEVVPCKVRSGTVWAFDKGLTMGAWSWAKAKSATWFACATFVMGAMPMIMVGERMAMKQKKNKLMGMGHPSGGYGRPSAPN